MIPFFILITILFTMTTLNLTAMGKKKLQEDEFASEDEGMTTSTSSENSPNRLGNRIQLKTQIFKKLRSQLSSALNQLEKIQLTAGSPTKAEKLEKINEQIQEIRRQLTSLE